MDWGKNLLPIQVLVIVSISDCLQREIPGFPQKGIKNLLHHLQLSFNTGAFVIHIHAYMLWVHTVCVCVYVHSCDLCMCVPTPLACLTGSDTCVAFPGIAGPVPNCQEINAKDSALLLSPHIHPSLLTSRCPPPTLSLSVSSFSFFPFCLAQSPY